MALLRPGSSMRTKDTITQEMFDRLIKTCVKRPIAIPGSELSQRGIDYETKN